MLKKVFDKIVKHNIKHQEAVAKVALNVEEQLIEYCRKVNDLQRNNKEES